MLIALLTVSDLATPPDGENDFKLKMVFNAEISMKITVSDFSEVYLYLYVL